MNNLLFEDANVIYAYTRAEAIEDGVLVDVSDLAQEAGFRVPVAITQAVWHEIIVPDEENRTSGGQSETGRLWDVLMILWATIRPLPGQADTITFQVLAVMENSPVPELVTLKAVCGPDDDGSPCVTIMLPEED